MRASIASRVLRTLQPVFRVLDVLSSLFADPLLPLSMHTCRQTRTHAGRTRLAWKFSPKMPPLRLQSETRQKERVREKAAQAARERDMKCERRFLCAREEMRREERRLKICSQGARLVRRNNFSPDERERERKEETQSTKRRWRRRRSW